MSDLPLDPERELRWLKRMRELSLRIAEEQDLQGLMPAILDAAIELTEAERGYLVQVTGENPDGSVKVKVRAARGFDKTALRGAQGDLSRTVIERVLERETRGLVTSSEEDADVLGVSSVEERRVKSIVCCPMRLRGKVSGVLYLDHRFIEGAFTAQDLPVLRSFADQAALAIETLQLLDEQAAAEEKLQNAKEEIERLKEGEEQAPDEPVIEARGSFGQLIGGSLAMAKLYSAIDRVSRSWDPVLIVGESGSGKERVAREIHARGSYPQSPFVSENCAALSDQLIESELFGHVQGAFTGASGDRAGLFREAGQGTLFLDEVGEMSPALQRKLLRVLQDGRVRPLGADAWFPFECRVIAATHQDLPKQIDQGQFREDLFFRLDVLRVSVPPLRERRGDVLQLIEHFTAKLHKPPLKLSPRALRLLQTYAWPGNVRELENEVRRLCTLDVREITAPCLSEEIRAGKGVTATAVDTSGKTLEEVERAMVEAALSDCSGNKARAARQLGVPRSSLYSLMKRHGLS